MLYIPGFPYRRGRSQLGAVSPKETSGDDLHTLSGRFTRRRDSRMIIVSYDLSINSLMPCWDVVIP